MKYVWNKGVFSKSQKILIKISFKVISIYVGEIASNGKKIIDFFL